MDEQITYGATTAPFSLLHYVFGWMAGALALTAAVAYYVAQSPAIFRFFFSSPLMLVALFIGQLALVFALNMLIERVSFGVALALFLAYAATVGITFSVIFQLYTAASIYATFAVTSGMFGATALYGYFTKADLSRFGSIAFMGLIGLIIAGLVNLWLKNQAFDYVISAIGVLVFTALTAYDMQAIKQWRVSAQNEDLYPKLALIGALKLYLDFINLFLYLLRFTGRRRN